MPNLVGFAWRQRLQGAAHATRVSPGPLPPRPRHGGIVIERMGAMADVLQVGQDRKSTRLNSSHANISYAVFCLKKKITKCRASAPQAVDATTSSVAAASRCMRWRLVVSYCSQPYYTAIPRLVSSSDYGSLRTVE